MENELVKIVTLEMIEAFRNSYKQTTKEIPIEEFAINGIISRLKRTYRNEPENHIAIINVTSNFHVDDGIVKNEFLILYRIL